MKKDRTLISSVLLGFSILFFLSGCCGNDATTDLSIRTTNVADNALIDFATMPLFFIANQGQVNEKARYYAKASRYTLWLTGEGMPSLMGT